MFSVFDFTLSSSQVLHLRITIHPLSDQGNLLDCAMMAAMAGLRGYRRREWEVEGGEVVVFPPDQRPPVALALHHVPLCITFAYFEGYVRFHYALDLWGSPSNTLPKK